MHLVVAADKLHNVRSLIADYRAHGESLWNRFNGGRAGTLWYYRAAADALATARPGALSAELLRGRATRKTRQRIARLISRGWSKLALEIRPGVVLACESS